ncbi:MAG TPA: cation diffusion facilitator family transporter [Candidatus Eisenbacteria bacterium]|jgi:cation diffusion facilitator family transporter
MSAHAQDARMLPRFAWLSALAALVTIVLKTGAWALTGSVGLLSDALESLVNLAGAMLAIAMLTVAARPEDDDHPYGHDKAEYFSSGAEGALILIAALGIAIAAVRRLLDPRPLEQIGVGLAVSAVAALVNLAVAIVILRAGRRHGSVTLEANAHHLLTDVWTSAGVILGVGAVALTRRLWLDPVVGLLVSANIVWTGLKIVRRAVTGLMDTALSPAEQEILRRALAPHVVEPVQVHALRSRQSGVRRFVSLHVLVPGEWSVQRGHELLERIEADIRRAIPSASVLTHLESLDDPASWDDIPLDRDRPPSAVR